MLAGEWCPITQREWFKPGTEPTEVCDQHFELPEAGAVRDRARLQDRQGAEEDLSVLNSRSSRRAAR